MTHPLSYTRTDLVSTVAMDDGKVNVFSIPMLRSLHELSTGPNGTRRRSS
jgi:hypothetical protein